MSAYLPPGHFDPSKYKYAIGYGRFSKPIQGEGSSRERQEEALFSACARWDWELLDQYFDPGISGGRGRNRAIGALRELLRRVRLKQIPPNTILVVEAFDRLTREGLTKAQLQFLDLIDRGLGVWIAMEGTGYDKGSINGNPGQLFTSIGQMMSANGVYKVMSDRALKGWHKRRPKKTRICPAWLELGGDGEYAVKEGAKEIIERIFDEVQYFGIDKVAARLNADGKPPFASLNHSKARKTVEGKAIWYDSHIHRIVNGRLVRGELATGKTEYVEKKVEVDGEEIAYEVPVRKLTGDYTLQYPEIVTEEVWQRARAAMAERQRYSAGRKGKGFPNLFTGIGKCAICGAAMVYKKTIKTRGGKVYEHLTCHNRRRKACVSTGVYDYRVVEREFLKTFRNDVMKILEDVPESSAASSAKSALANLKADLLHMDARNNTLMATAKEAAAIGDNSSEQIAQMMKMLGIVAERDKLMAEIASMERKVAQLDAAKPESEQIASLRDLMDRLGNLDGQEEYEVRAKVNAGLRKLVRVDFWLGDMVDVTLQNQNDWMKRDTDTSEITGVRMPVYHLSCGKPREIKPVPDVIGPRGWVSHGAEAALQTPDTYYKVTGEG